MNGMQGRIDKVIIIRLMVGQHGSHGSFDLDVDVLWSHAYAETPRFLPDMQTHP